ncbi:hypothetical protein ACFLZL_04080 [Thermodesulfobacteriota bacterium]
MLRDPPHGISGTNPPKNKGGQVRYALKADDPALLASVGVSETRPPEEHRRPQTVTASISADPVMLGK